MFIKFKLLEKYRGFKLREKQWGYYGRIGITVHNLCNNYHSYDKDICAFGRI